MIVPIVITSAAFAVAILMLCRWIKRDYDGVVDGLFLLMAATIVALIAWLIWALLR